ncbi:hypothetical protein [Massilia sp. H6]|uniref:hypothetical protein n=1 Tax=Massilia sp. H6 TaxID=2970464 RepID=UPI00216808C2|nr:hypothetical protein [Massilia sp. H6]UVW28315.1 hypothetical protein NRS07_17600 [Massilia sp. H6]
MKEAGEGIVIAGRNSSYVKEICWKLPSINQIDPDGWGLSQEVHISWTTRPIGEGPD